MNIQLHYLNKIKNKKTSGKTSNVFSCLTSKVDGIKFEEDKKTLRIKRRLTALKNRISEGKVLKLKYTTRFIKWSNFLNLPIPELILEKHEIFSKQSYISKHKKQKNRKRKPVRYDTYIKSKKWEQRRNTFFRTHDYKCFICGSSKYLHLHHKYYGNYGDEKDEDLVPLCKEHHAEFHKTMKHTKKDMRKETEEFLKILC